MIRIVQVGAIVVLLSAAACSRDVDVDKVPVGTEVQVTREDGALVQGKLAERDPQVVKVSTGNATRTVARDDIADVRVVDETKPASIPPAARFREVIVPSGTTVAVRLDSSLGSETSRVEQTVTAELAEPIRVDGVEVVPARSPVRGEVRSAVPSAKVKGRASLSLVFDSLTAYGDRYPIEARYARTASATTKDDARKIGIPAAAGGVIGAIVGGKKGAAVGAAVGGGAGTAVVLSTSGKEIELPAGTVLSLTLARPIEVRVPLEPKK